MSVYLLVKYYRNPRDPKKTWEPGYLSNADNVVWDENIAFAKNIRRKDILECNVILNLLEKQVVKCSVENLISGDFDNIFSYFYKNYQKYFDVVFSKLNINIEPIPENLDPTPSGISANVVHGTAEILT